MRLCERGRTHSLQQAKLFTALLWQGASAELKTDFTQHVEDAIDQYRFDRLPRPEGQAAEPLLTFPSGALGQMAYL